MTNKTYGKSPMADLNEAADSVAKAVHMAKPHISKQHGLWWCIKPGRINHRGTGSTPIEAYNDYTSAAVFFRAMDEANRFTRQLWLSKGASLVYAQ